VSIQLTRDDGQALVLDGYTRISYAPTISATSHPIEAGAPVTDHAQEEPLRFTVEGALVNPVQQYVARPLAVEEALRFFETAAGRLISVSTPDGVYTSCLLEGWGHAQTNRRGRRFDLSFKQVRLASPVSVTIAARTPSPRAGAGMADEVDAGEQAGTQLPAGESSGLTSVSAALYDLAGGG